MVFERIVELGLGLGLDIVAEGVETTEQAMIAEGIGCTFGQGFFWGRPVPAPDAMEAALQDTQHPSSNASERELDLDWVDVARKPTARKA